MHYNTGIDYLEAIVDEIERPDVSVKEAARELHKNILEQVQVHKVGSLHDTYKEAIVLVTNQAKNYRTLRSIKDCLIERNIVTSRESAMQLAKLIQLDAMVIDSALLESLVDETDDSEVRELEQWHLQTAVEREPKFLP